MWLCSDMFKNRLICTHLSNDWVNCLLWQKFLSSCQTACFLLLVKWTIYLLWMVLNDIVCVCARMCECVSACMHEDLLYACLHATCQLVRSTNMSTMSYSMFGLELGQLLIVWCVFSSSSPLPFSCPRFDYNQVFFLILQWAKEQHTVQRASQWAALCWMVSNTWGSDQLVSLASFVHLPSIMPAMPASSVTFSYHRADQHQSSCA